MNVPSEKILFTLSFFESILRLKILFFHFFIKQVVSYSTIETPASPEFIASPAFGTPSPPIDFSGSDPKDAYQSHKYLSSSAREGWGALAGNAALIGSCKIGDDGGNLGGFSWDESVAATNSCMSGLEEVSGEENISCE